MRWCIYLSLRLPASRTTQRRQPRWCFHPYRLLNPPFPAPPLAPHLSLPFISFHLWIMSFSPNPKRARPWLGGTKLCPLDLLLVWRSGVDCATKPCKRKRDLVRLILAAKECVCVCARTWLQLCMRGVYIWPVPLLCLCVCLRLHM